MEYIHYYTFTTGHMRKSYSNEIEKEIRIRVRELIKFERGISCNYTVPFMDGTKLHIVADGSFYSATVMIEAKGEDIVLLTTVGCKDETGLSFAMKAINDAQKDLTGKELVGCHPKIPFIMDILTPFCFVIADWSGDFCRTSGKDSDPWCESVMETEFQDWKNQQSEVRFHADRFSTSYDHI